jgi:hypothetical protein
MAKAGGGATNLRHAVIGFATTAALAIGTGSPSAQNAGERRSPPEMQSMAQDAIHRLDLQTDFPREPEPFRITLPPETLWLVIAAAIGVLLYAFRDMIPILRMAGGGAWTSDEAVAGDLARKDPSVALAAADELATEGRYAEAMHVLLLRGLADIRARLDEPFADSLTSREILRSPRLPEDVRTSLRDVVSRVEWTYFGEHPAEREDYLACRESFNALARSLHGGMAA